ncbi:MAG: AbrB/MazE/SpoVT family DNA-binding domain-containing protein [Bacteroidota bacterium]|nr:AbrB/MazE/SpoVT family DNA-binding domain-containing protein [Bacteroidota bacterium]
MKTKVIKIGSSRGIKIPSTILDRCGLRNEVEFEIIEDKIIIQSAHKIRENWEIAFQKMAKNQDDVLFDKHINQTTWDEEEWEW